MMQIPAPLYGEYAEVRKRCRKVLARVLREQQPLLEAFEAEGMIDTADHRQLFVLDGPSPLVSKYVHFQCYVPLRLLIEKPLGPVGPAVQEAVFSALLKKPWGMLCMLSSNNMVLWFFKEETGRFRRFVWAMLRHWDTLDAEGARYSSGSNAGEPLWDAALPLVQALAHLGVPRDMLRSGMPLPAGGLPALLAQADRSLAGDLVDLGAAATASPPTRVGAPMAGTPFTEVTPNPSSEIFMSEQMVAAMRANDVDAVRRLVLTGEPVNAGNMEGDETPLLWAARKGHTELVRFLLDRGADVEDRSDEGESPLMLAAMNGHRNTVQLLLDRGADPNYVTGKGWDVVQFAELSRDPEVIAMLEQVFRGRD